MCLTWPQGARAADTATELAILDQRLTTVAEKLLAANRHLCRSQMPGTGLTFLSADQYAADRRPALFDHGMIAIGTLAPESAAAKAGLLRGDLVRAIDAVPVENLLRRGPQDAGKKHNEVLFDRLAEKGDVQSLQITIGREHEIGTHMLQVGPVCRAFYEVTGEQKKRARSNGKIIQLSRALVALVDDDQLAVIFAHELAHNILEHRNRLSLASVDGGLIGDLGLGGRSRRQVEIEADRLTPHLLANAGFDPAIAPAFFLSKEGRELTGNLSFVYPSPSRRAQIIDEEILAHLSSRSGLSHAPLLLSLRADPETGD